VDTPLPFILVPRVEVAALAVFGVAKRSLATGRIFSKMCCLAGEVKFQYFTWVSRGVTRWFWFRDGPFPVNHIFK